MPSKIYDALILGAGPAGLSAALGLARIKRTALVLSNQCFRNNGIKAMHTVLGFDGAHPADFRRVGRKQIERYGDGIEFAEGEAISVRRAYLEEQYQGFEMEEKGGKVWRGRKMVLAMGARDVFPDLEGYAENWPDNIYQCLFCDGRERSHLPIGLMGFPSATHLNHAMMICHLSGDKPNVRIFANGPSSENPATKEAMNAAQSAGCVLDERVIVKLTRAPEEEKGVDLHFQDGGSIRMGFLVDKPPTEPVGQQMMVDGLGVEIIPTMFGTCLKRNEPFGETSVKGCFVAGDAGTPMTQVTIAVAQGVGAAGGASAQLCAEEGVKALERVSRFPADEIEISEKDTTYLSRIK